MVYQLHNLGSVLETLTRRRKRERVNQSHSHCVFESIDHVPPNIPVCSHSTQLDIFEDNAAAKLEACHKNAQSEFVLVV